MSHEVELAYLREKVQKLEEENRYLKRFNAPRFSVYEEPEILSLPYQPEILRVAAQVEVDRQDPHHMHVIVRAHDPSNSRYWGYRYMTNREMLMLSKFDVAAQLHHKLIHEMVEAAKKEV